jgi:arsenate reductase
VLNRAGTTYRQLPQMEKGHLDRSVALRLMLAQPSLIKRPILEIGPRVVVGFTPAVYEQHVAVGHP